MPKYRTLILMIGILIGQCARAMVLDNRYVPLFQLPYVTVADRNSYATVDTFITTASKFFEREDREIGLQEVWGKYDQGKIAYAIECTGKENLLLPNWRNYELNWYMEGKQQTQGFAFSFHKTIGPWFFIGCDSLFMRLNARTEFTFDEESPNKILQPGNLLELDEIRRKMNDQLGLTAGNISQVGFGDFQFYLGVYGSWDYLHKFRRLYTEFRLGGIAPTGVKQDLCKLGSIPFGGDGHWGVYVSNWSEFEVKEDWKAGFLLRVNKRITRIAQMRMPIKEEILPFAPVIGDVKIDPAPTFIFAPYFSMENLREGFGLRVVYTLRTHGKDYWCDARKCNNALDVTLDDAQRRTAWNSDYFTLNAFYDFGKTKTYRSFEPIVYASWDIPSAMLATKRVAKAHRITLGIQMTF